jgi:quercetin dioxygenase-like cupin family protein
VSDVDPGEHELGPVGQRVLMENDRVRVWQITLRPGESQAWHQHEHPYLVVAVEGAMNVVTVVDGQEIPAPEPTGAVIYREPGPVHMLTNIGETTYVSRLVELLDVPA